MTCGPLTPGDTGYKVRGGVGREDCMSAPPTPTVAGSQSLECLICGDQRSLVLDQRELAELLTHQQLRLFCANCQSITAWTGVERDRRGGAQRRASRHVRLELPIRVRASLPQLNFTEVTYTVNASRDCACFNTRQPLREGMEVNVLVPYVQGETLPETRARVVRVEKKGDDWEVAVQFLRK